MKTSLVRYQKGMGLYVDQTDFRTDDCIIFLFLTSHRITQRRLKVMSAWKNKKNRPSSIYSLLDSLFLSLPPARLTKFSLILSKSVIGYEANLSHRTASGRMK